MSARAIFAALASALLCSATAGAAKTSASPSNCGAGPPETVIPACTKDIDDPRASPDQRRRALRWRGVAFFRVNNLDRALADFSAALALKPNDAQALNNRGLIYQRRGQLTRAIADYDKAIAAAPSQYATYANRSNALRLKGDLARALADASHCIALAPNFAGGYKARGLARKKTGDADGALADLSKAVELAPTDAEARAARAALRLSRGDYRGAAGDFDAALRTNPKNVAALNGYGVALMEEGDFSAALADFDRALKLAPAAAGIHVNRGFAHMGAGDFAAAAADFQIWARADPDHPYAALWLYMARARAGERDATPPAPGAAKAWPAPVAAFFAGKLTASGLEAAAKGGDAKAQKAQTCEAAFYIGEMALIARRRAQAEHAMKRAIESCPASLLERAAALGEWRRLRK